MDDEKLLKDMAEHLNLDVWKVLTPLNECIYGCRNFNEPLYKGRGGEARTLNPKYLIHIQTTHGVPMINFVDMIADKLYKTNEGKNKMLAMYSFLDK